jgi:hypothetical protein
MYLGLLNTFEETEHDECERTEGSLQGHLPLHELQVRRRLPLQQLKPSSSRSAGRPEPGFRPAFDFHAMVIAASGIINRLVRASIDRRIYARSLQPACGLAMPVASGRWALGEWARPEPIQGG